MRRLTGLDASFLYLETPTTHMHVSGTYIFDPSGVEGGYRFERVKALIVNRLHRLPPFRWRLVEVPFGLHHPIWIEDPAFDVDNHVIRRILPPPGRQADLLEMAGEIMGQPLNRAHPLWEIHLIEGLQGGRVAMVAKTHHAAIDGASGAELVTNLLDLSPEVTTYEDVEWEPEPMPSDTEMLVYALNSLARQPAAFGEAVRDTFSGALSRRTYSGPDASSGASTGGLFHAPRTSINRPIGAGRLFAVTEVSLADVKDIRRSLGGTVNDVVLALCAGALRRYLLDRDELPTEPLVAMVPISVRAEEEKGSMGNRVANMFVALATELADPVERLNTIRTNSKSSKARATAAGTETLATWAQFAPPLIAAQAAKLYSSTRMADHHRPAFNVTISNVAGPQFPLYFAGARLTAWYPMGPIFDGSGLNITVMSYDNVVYFGLIACSETVARVGDIAGFMNDAAAELLSAAKNAPLGMKSSAQAQKASPRRSKP